jgi:hypothetical protein
MEPTCKHCGDTGKIKCSILLTTRPCSYCQDPEDQFYAPEREQLETVYPWKEVVPKDWLH